MKPLKLVAVVTAVVVVLATFIARNKHLLLKVPKIGYVLHAIAGGPVPPYMDVAIFDRQEEFLLKGDVMLSIPAKAGTTWMRYTLHLLREKGEPEPFNNIYDVLPWSELVYYPGQPEDERIQAIRDVGKKFAFNIVETHSSPTAFRVRDDIKYIVVVRNPYDMAASARAFFQSHEKLFAEMWGGFPPGAGEPELTPDSEWEHLMLVDGGNGVPLFRPFFVDALRNWWPYRNQSNVLIVHYSDRIRNDEEQVTRIANFLGIDASPSVINKVVKKASFSEMKKINQIIEGQLLFEPYKKRGLIGKDVYVLSRKGNALLNKGPQRKGESEIPRSMREGIDRLLRTLFTPKMIEYLHKGGRLPVEDELPEH